MCFKLRYEKIHVYDKIVIKNHKERERMKTNERHFCMKSYLKDDSRVEFTTC